jgi:hypothetical protein
MPGSPPQPTRPPGRSSPPEPSGPPARTRATAQPDTATVTGPRARRSRRRRGTHQHHTRRAKSQALPPPREEESCRRGRPIYPTHHLAPALRRAVNVHRPRADPRRRDAAPRSGTVIFGLAAGCDSSPAPERGRWVQYATVASSGTRASGPSKVRASACRTRRMIAAGPKRRAVPVRRASRSGRTG